MAYPQYLCIPHCDLYHEYRSDRLVLIMGALHAIHAVNEEDQPTYNADPKRGHLTMVHDDVFDTIGAQLGGSALAVYMMLERRANKNGTCEPSYDTLAMALNASRRHIIRQIKVLTDAGFITIEKRRNGDKGNLPNLFTLPRHPNLTTLYPSDSGAPPPSDRTGNNNKTLVTQIHPPGDNPSDSGAPKVDTSNKELNIDTGEPTKPSNRVYEIALWYATRIDGVLPGKGAREWQEAKRLASTPITDAEMGELFDWLSGQSWVESISLSLMANKYNEWRSSKQTAPKKYAHNSPRAKGPVF
jgi:hypothetical protein